MLLLLCCFGCSVSPSSSKGGALEDGNAIAGIVHDSSGSVAQRALVVAVPATFDPSKDVVPSSDSVRTDSAGKFALHLSFTSPAQLWITTLAGNVAFIGSVLSGAQLDGVKCVGPSTMKLTVPQNTVGSTIYVGIMGTPFIEKILVADTLLNITGLASLSAGSLFYKDSAGIETIVTDSLNVPAGNSVYVSGNSVQWASFTLPGVSSGANSILMQGDTLVFADSTGIRRFKFAEGKFTLLDNPVTGAPVYDVKQFGNRIVYGLDFGFGFCDANGVCSTITQNSVNNPLARVLHIEVASAHRLYFVCDDASSILYVMDDTGTSPLPVMGVLYVTAFTANPSDGSAFSYVEADSMFYSMTVSGAYSYAQDTRPLVLRDNVTHLVTITHMVSYHGTIWATPPMGLYKLESSLATDLQSQIINDTITDLKISSAGSVWMIGASGTADIYSQSVGYRLFSSANSPLSTVCKPKALSVQGSIGWISTSDGQLFRIKAEGCN